MSHRSAEQERWLDEAVRALGDAERLTGLLAVSRPRQDLALAALQAQIMALRCEVERLQREHRDPRRDFNPNWIGLSVWDNLAR